MFFRQLCFSSTLLTLTIAYNLYSTIDYSTKTKYDCMHMYLSSDFFREVIFFRKGFEPKDRFIDELIVYCVPAEHYLVNEKACTVNGGIVWKFSQLKKQNITSVDLLNWNAPMDIIDNYEHYLQTDNLELSIFSFCNCTNVSYFGVQCQYEFGMANTTLFENIVISHFRNLPYRDFEYLGVLEDDASVTCYKRDASCFGACLDWRQICNGIVDCTDGWDEVSCHLLEFNECENSEYRCRSGHCIPMIFAFDGMGDCADGSDEDDDITISFDHTLCFRRVPNLLCDERNNAWLMFPCGDGQVISDILRNCENGRNFRTVKMVYETSEVTLCWQHFICVFKIDFYFSSLVNCSALCGEYHDCSRMLLLVCGEKTVLFPPRPIVFDTVSIYFTYFMNRTIDGPPDFICYSGCDHLYPPSLNINGHSCRSTTEFVDKFIDSSIMSTIFFLEVLTLFDGCRNRTEMSNNSLVFHCPIGGKVISFHRVQDGFIDCPLGFDESFNGSTCIENSTQRFRCWTNSNTCVHRRFVQDVKSDCPDKSDEFLAQTCHVDGKGSACEQRRRFDQSMNIHYEFQELCNGMRHYSHLSQILNDTDETDCEDFRCLSSPLTRCNGFWDCKNGHDELNCSLDILPAKVKSTKLLHSLYGCNAMEHLCLHFSNRSQDLTRPCLPVTYAGDGQIDCYGATDERLSFCHYRNPEYEFLKNYRCAGETYRCIRVADICDSGPSCPLEDDETICHWFSKNFTKAFFYCQNGTGISQFARCNGKLDCPSGEDEWFCDLTIPAPAPLQFRRINIPIYPPDLQSNRTQVMVHKQAPIHFTLDRSSSWYCNRGIPITDSRRQRCLCPRSYYGERCEYQRERISLILHIVSSLLLQRDVAIKCVVYLIDIDTLDILAEEEILYFSYVHPLYKHIVSLASIRAQNSFLRIDVYEVNIQRVITYRASWKLLLPFPFLPVRRLVHQLDLSSDQDFSYESRSICHSCLHGRCLSYQNSDDAFCHCQNGWTGANCNQSLLCAPGSLSLNSYRCLCPMSRDGDQCFAPYKPVCQCENGATCVPLSAHTNQSACLCPNEYFGRYCERQHASLTVAMLDQNLPKTLPLVLFHFVRLSVTGSVDIENIFLFEHVSTDHPLLLYHTNYERLPVTVLGKVYYSASIDDFRYYIVLFIPIHRHVSETWPKHVLTQLKTSQQCLHVREMEIFKKPVNIFAYPYLKRIKFYLRGCFDNTIRCFHDEVYLCFCSVQNNQTGNCLIYNHTREICQRSSYCLNGGLCIENRRAGIVQFACICPSCHYYGTLCQFSLEKQGLSLDALVGLEMHTGKSLSEQSIVIKLSLAILTTLLIVGLIGNTLSIITLARKKSRETGCGYYLLHMSLYNQLALIVLSLRFIYLLNTQIVVWTNRSKSLILCQCLEYGLIILPNLSNWLSACVSIERTYAVACGALFDKQSSIRMAKYLCLLLLIVLAGITVHEPISRQLIEDPRLGRYTWCVTKFHSDSWQKLASILSITHLIGPFLVNVLSTGGLIVILARQRSTIRKGKTIKAFSTVLRKQIIHYKHLIISPMVLLILNLPRLVISLGSLCVDTSWRNYVFLAGYLISFIPFTATFLIFILPAPLYQDEFKAFLSHIRLCFSH